MSLRSIKFFNNKMLIYSTGISNIYNYTSYLFPGTVWALARPPVISGPEKKHELKRKNASGTLFLTCRMAWPSFPCTPGQTSRRICRWRCRGPRGGSRSGRQAGSRQSPPVNGEEWNGWNLKCLYLSTWKVLCKCCYLYGIGNIPVSRVISYLCKRDKSKYDSYGSYFTSNWYKPTCRQVTFFLVHCSKIAPKWGHIRDKKVSQNYF